MIRLRNNILSPQLKFKYNRLTSWDIYLWVFITISIVSFYIGVVINQWMYTYCTFDQDWTFLQHYINAKGKGFIGSYDDFRFNCYYRCLLEAGVITIFSVILVITYMIILRIIYNIIGDLFPKIYGLCKRLMNSLIRTF